MPKSTRSMLLSLLILAGMLASSVAAIPAQAAHPAQDPTQPPSERPIVLVESYYTDVDTISPGKDFNLFLTITNRGQNSAINILATFTPGDLIPRETGGALVISSLDPGQSKTVKQPMSVTTEINGGGISSIAVNVTYTDVSNNASYTAAFNIALHVNYPSYAPAAPTPTPTAIRLVKPQLSITAYQTDVDPLQPGLPFNLSLELRNLGNADAKSVTMITGGGSASSGSSSTPEPGGVSGGTGEFTNFAPLKSSNIHFLGDLPSGETLKADQSLIVNTTTQPGAYSMKFSFVYVDSRGVRFVDDQVITLLVYQLPLVEITFYREAGPFFAGQMGQLPIQITNLSRKPVILGNLKASVPTGGSITNNTTLVGAMDPGGYFTLDANLIPDLPGPMDIDITVSYTDDFNQPQTIHQVLPVTVLDAPVMPPDSGIPGGNGDSGGIPVPVNETFMDKLMRFVKGLIGLDSAVPTQNLGPGGPVTEPALPENGGGPGGKPIIVAPGKGG